MKYRLLFVCLGNICRSPAAQGIFEALIESKDQSNDFIVDSAGTYAGHAGDLPDSRMRHAAQKRGIKLTHRSRVVRMSDFEDFDCIVAMDDSNFHNLNKLAPSIEGTEKIVKMADFLVDHEIDHIPDPYYQGADGFEYVLDLLQDGCQELHKSISNKIKSPNHH